MSMVGTYICSDLDATLVIKNANNSLGEASGVFSFAGKTLGIGVGYHFENDKGPITNLHMRGYNNFPNCFMGAAGITDNRNYKTIELRGGFSEVDGVTSFGGKFVRV